MLMQHLYYKNEKANTFCDLHRGSRGSRLDLEMAEEWGKIPRLVSSSTSKNKDQKSRH